MMKSSRELNLPQKSNVVGTPRTVSLSAWTKINQAHENEHKPEFQ